MKATKTKTLKNKILVSLLAIVLLQSFVTISVFQISDTSNQLVLNSVQIFTNSIGTKCKEMEAQMLSWSDITDFQGQIDALAQALEEQENLPAGEILKDDEKRQDFLESSINAVLGNLRYTKANCSFIILDGGDPDTKDAVYLQDINPQDQAHSNKDILALAGPSDMIMDRGFTLHSMWTARLPVSDSSLFYHKPLDAGNDYPEIDSANLGYWSCPFRIKEEDWEIITYTRPLLDSKHHSYGVIGISISMDYLLNYLSLNAIGIDHTASYYLGITQDNRNFGTVLVNRNFYKASLASNSVLAVNKPKDAAGLHPVTTGGYDAGSLFYWTGMKLYNSNTPFEQEEWVLGGLIPKNVLYAPSDRFNLAVGISCLLGFLIACAGGILITVTMVKPLRGLSNALAAMKPYEVRIPKTGILEVDNLVEKIEDLSSKMYRTGSKVADILEMSPLPLGICEYEKGSDTIFCTRKYLEVTGLSLDSWKNNYADYEEFKEKSVPFQEKLHRMPEELDIYHYEDGPREEWFLVKQTTTEKGVLTLLMNVTHDMLEKLKIKHDRDYDVLTDLYNRRAFYHLVKNILDKPQKPEGLFSIWDLDNLKYINDTYGHDMGDKYICLLADVIKEHLTAKMIAARMSGDEFTIFLYGAALPEMIEKLHHIHSDFANHKLLLPDGNLLPVSVSAGMVSIAEGRDYEQLFRYADFAMYEIKKNAKGGIRLFDRSSHLKNYILVQGVGELNRILTENSIRYAFQPIVDIRRKKVMGYEALMRPQSDTLGSPLDFLRVAKEQSKLNQVEALTWFQGLKQYLNLPGRPEDARLFINSLPTHVLLPNQIKQLEEQYGSFLHQVVLEITENAVPDTECQRIKEEFRSKWDMGYALDDYGSGYNNTDILVSGQFDYVKLTIELIRGIHAHEDRQDLVLGMIQYCHSKGIEVIAEGVETKEELVKIMDLGVDYVQGYYFSRPVFDLEPIPESLYL